MHGQGKNFPEFPDPAVSAAETPGTDQPPAAGREVPVSTVGSGSRSDARIASLRALVSRLAPGAVGAGNRVPLGFEALDRALGGGLPQAALHVVAAGTPDGLLRGDAATGFVAFLAARLQRATHGSLIWLPARSDLYGPGLARLGLDTGQLILIETPRAADRLWAFEEALRTPGLAGVVAELDRIEPKPARRLQLAAETAGTTGLVLQSNPSLPILAATTRWSVDALPGGRDRFGFPDGFERPRWQVALQRSRLGHTGSWCVEMAHDPTTDRIALAAALCDRASAARLATVGAG